jgi:hypothetical protein
MTGSGGRPKRQAPLTQAQIEERRARYNSNRNKSRRDKKKKANAEKKEWEDIGWIVSKMSNQAKMSQEAIYRVLGGVFTKTKILEWSRKGRQYE